MEVRLAQIIPTPGSMTDQMMALTAVPVRGKVDLSFGAMENRRVHTYIGYPGGRLGEDRGLE